MQKKDQQPKDAHSKHENSPNHKAGHEGMAMRGVSRPMAEQEVRQHESTMQEQATDGEHSTHSGHEGETGGHHMMMDEGGKQMMLSMHYKQTLWVYWLVVILGFWTILSPLTFSYAKGIVEPSGGREVWLSLADRIAVLKWSDIISGILLVVFGWRSLTPNRPISRWICCFVGVWLTVAPIIFWAPTAVSYLNDTLVGALVIALTILIPGMPNMILHMQMGPETPPGWSYNPSSWPQRAIMIALAFAGWIVSRYLTTFQLGYIDHAWDPFFGESTKQVLNSTMSHSMPISDAGLGAIAYTIEFLMGFMGSPARWRTMPWMVTIFGILVIPLGLVHIFLVVSQPLAVGAWCSMCLLAAGIMLPMISLQVDEVIAMGQFMIHARKKGQSLWNAFWMGGTMEGGMMKDERSPDLVTLPWQFRNVFNASLWGMSFPWTLVISILLGVGLVAAPGLLGIGIKETAADVNHLGGSLIVVVAVIAMAEALRIARYANVLLGLAVASIPWFVEGSTLALNITSLIAGLAVVALALPLGPKRETYGSWDRYIK